MDSDVNIPLTSPASSCPHVSNCGSGRVFRTSKPSELEISFSFSSFFIWRLFTATLYHGNFSFISPRKAMLSMIWNGIVSFCNARGLKWGLEVFFFFLHYFFFFWSNKQPCFWKAGCNVPLCTRRGTELKQYEWTAVCQVCEGIYFLYHYFLLLLARCCDSTHKCNIGICQQQKQKTKNKTTPQTCTCSIVLSLITLVGGGLLMTYWNWWGTNFKRDFFQHVPQKGQRSSISACHVGPKTAAYLNSLNVCLFVPPVSEFSRISQNNKFNKN